MANPYLVIRDIVKKQRDRFKRVEDRRIIRIAKVFSVDGSIFVPNKPDYVWVHEFGTDGSQAQALRGGVQVVEDMPVLIAFDPRQPFHWKIIGIYVGDIDPGSANQIFNYQVGNHGENHQWQTDALKGPDPVKIWQPPFMPLKTEGNGSDLIIAIWGTTYWYNNVPVESLGGQLDLTASVPAAGLTRYVLTYIDKSTGLPAIVNGDTIAIGSTPVVPTLPGDALASGLVQLTFGQTDVNQEDDITDARNMFGVSKDILASIVVDKTSGNVVTDITSGNVVWE